MVRIQGFADHLWGGAGKEEPAFLEVGAFERTGECTASHPRAARGEKGLATSASPPKVDMKNNQRV